MAGRDRAHRGPEQRLRCLAHLPGVRQVPIDESGNTIARGIVLPRELDHVDAKLDLPHGLIDLVDHPGDLVDALQRTAQVQLPLSHDRDPDPVHRIGRLASFSEDRCPRRLRLRLTTEFLGTQRLLLLVQEREFASDRRQILLDRWGWRGDKGRGLPDLARRRSRLRRRRRRRSTLRKQGRLLGLQPPSLFRQHLQPFVLWGR